MNLAQNPGQGQMLLPFNDPAALNSATFIDFFNRLMGLATTIYEWSGMPETVNLRFLEKTLFQYGKAVFVKDETLGFMVLKVTTAGQLNVYDEPVKYQAFGIGYHKVYEADQCVLIRNNPLMIPTQATVQLFAHRLYEVERSLDVNIKGQKFPVVIKCNQQQELSLKNIYAKYNGNHPVIAVDKSLDLNTFEVLNTGSPFVADKLMIYKHDIWNEAMSFLGISNANTDKRERLITDEVQANDQLIQLAAEVMLATRREAAKAISDMYQLPVTVKMKEYQQAGIPEQGQTQDQGGKDGDEE